MTEPPDIQRRRFLDSLRGFVSAAASESTSVGLMLVDVSGLKKVNGACGYESGDALLYEAYARLVSLSKLPDTVFRIGGHGFAFVLPQLQNPAFVALAVNKVTAILDDGITLAGRIVSAEPRVGVAVSQHGCTDALELLAEAESSLRKVKEGRALSYTEVLDAHTTSDKADELELRFENALRDGELELYYQPKIELSTNRIASAEALLRWTDDSGKPVLSPPAIVSLAAQIRLAFELTQWIASHCIRTLSQWTGDMDIGLAFNVQANLIHHPDLVSALLDANAIWGVDPARITVEITEDAIMEDREAGFECLCQIRDAGMVLSIDDFGTGYSSMSYFQQIPATELKIDQSFVRTLHEDEQSYQLVKIMIEIGHQFGMRVVAEGVESAASLAALRDLGCDYVQGYYITGPLPRAEFERWARDRSLTNQVVG